MTRKERKAQTRESLRQAALACFADRGFGATQIADVARGAGVATGTFYVHFEGKEELLDDLIGEFNEALVETLRAVWARSAERGLEGAVRDVAGACLDHWAEHRDLVRAFADRAVQGRALGAMRDGISPPAADFLRMGIESYVEGRGTPAVDPELLVQGILGLWMRLGIHYLFGHEDGIGDRDATVDALVRLTLGALSGALPGIEWAVPSTGLHAETP